MSAEPPVTGSGAVQGTAERILTRRLTETLTLQSIRRGSRSSLARMHTPHWTGDGLARRSGSSLQA
jgi:hypothetical protein